MLSLIAYLNIYLSYIFFQLTNSLNERELMVADVHEMIRKSQKVINYILNKYYCIKGTFSDLEKIDVYLMRSDSFGKCCCDSDMGIPVFSVLLYPHPYISYSDILK